MTNLRFIGMIAAIIFLSGFTFSNSISWNISDDYSIKFSSEDPTGVFTSLTGDIMFDEDNLSASVFDVQVDVNSINTGNGMQNRHAKGDKWFDAEQYPVITFTSENFSQTDAGYEVTGMLEIHGVSKELTMPFTFVDNTFQSSFTINRIDFNVGSTEGMAQKVPQELLLEISVPVTR